MRENKAFIRAALRTTYGLQEGLKLAEQAALDGMARMRSKQNLDQNVSQQLWEETTGRVVDHIRALLRRAQETVANWREFGPEEVAELSSAEEVKAIALTEVTTAASQVRAMLEGLGNALNPAQIARLQDRIEALEQERARISATSALAVPEKGEARRLLAAGAYEEAIDAYSSLIAQSPDQHSLFTARARARQLKGDDRGALEDLAAAELLCPTDPLIPRMRSDIEQGRRPQEVIVRAPTPWKEKVELANGALFRGDGELALQLYAEAEALGLLPVFAAENAAMALVLLGRTREARQRIAAIESQIAGAFVQVQASIILALADTLDGADASSSIRKLRADVAEVLKSGTKFQVSRSPLQFLFGGLIRMGKSSEAVSQIIKIAQDEPIFTLGDPIPE